MTPPTDTAQSLFNTVVTHLLNQNQRSHASGSGACLYRGPHNLKCAVGILLTDDEYDPSMDDLNNATGVEDINLPERLRPFRELLIDVQHVHDNIDPPEWTEALTQTAVDHGLCITP